MQPSEINEMWYWEFEEYIKLLNTKNKEEKDAHDEQAAKQGESTPNLGKFGNFNLSNFKVPDIPRNFKP